MANLDSNCCKPLQNTKKVTPLAPPLPRSAAPTCSCECLAPNNSTLRWRNNNVSSTATNLWERLFDQGYKADVCINTDNGGVVYAHYNILVSPFISLH